VARHTCLATPNGSHLISRRVLLYPSEALLMALFGLGDEPRHTAVRRAGRGFVYRLLLLPLIVHSNLAAEEELELDSVLGHRGIA
jgi:hypothetical protein